MMNQSYVPSTNGLASYADVSPDYELAPIGLGSMREQVEKLAEYGRYGDIYVVHAAEGETVIPMEVLEANPQIKSLLFHQMEEMGLDPERYVVGNDLNSLNPVTGMPEFFFKKIWKAAKKYIIPMAINVIGNMIAPGIGGLIATAMYTKLSGGSWGDVLKSTALAWGGQALMGGAMSAFKGGTFGSGFMAGAKAPLTAGAGLFKGWTGAGLTGATAGQNPLAQGMFSETLGATPYQGGLYPSYDPKFDGVYATEGGKGMGFESTVIKDPSALSVSGKAPVADQAALAEIMQRNATLAELGHPPLDAAEANKIITEMASSGPALGDYSPTGFVLDKGSDVGDALLLGGAAYGAGLFDADEPDQPKPKDLAGFVDRTTAQELIDADPGRYRIGAENLDPYANVASLEMGVPPLAPPPVPTLPFTGPTLPGTGAIGFEEIRSPFTAGTDLNPVPTEVPPLKGWTGEGLNRFGSYRAARGGAVNYPKQVGYINGPGTATSDSIPAMLSNGEFVMTKRAVDGAGGPRTMYDLMRNFEMRT